MNPIKKFFIFVFNDLKGDVECVKYIFKQTKEGKPLLDPEKKRLAIQTLKTIPRDLLKESWYWVLAIIFVFALGTLVGNQYAVVECNNFIIENYENKVCTDVAGPGYFDNLNFSTEIPPDISTLPDAPSHEASES